jgi:transposase InsO family protein
MVNRHPGIGWEYLHVAIDDASRLAYTARRSGPTTKVGPWEPGALPAERKASAIAFLARALAWCARHGGAVERVMTDNGSAYRSHDFRNA